MHVKSAPLPINPVKQYTKFKVFKVVSLVVKILLRDSLRKVPTCQVSTRHANSCKLVKPSCKQQERPTMQI